MKQIHYNIDNIAKIGARFNLIYGERSNGKSYQVKHKMGVEKYLKTGKRFILMRRWKEEITSEKIEQYFMDVDVQKLTNGKFNCITLYRKCLYLSVFDNETGKTKRYDKIGYVVALSTEQNYAGASYLDVDDIIFEEFMTRSIYLNNESNKLMNFYATVDRKRLTTKLWLVGNSISRVCPYINDWGLHKIISQQKQGTIETVNITSEYEENPIIIAIEYCKSTGKSSGTIGSNAEMINTGAWETKPQPHLQKSYTDFTKIFCIGFQYQGFRFLGDLLMDNDTKEICWFIKPYFKEFDDKTIVFSDLIKVSMFWQRDIYNITIPNDKLRKLCKTFREDIIFFSDDLTGTDFKQVIDFKIKM